MQRRVCCAYLVGTLSTGRRHHAIQGSRDQKTAAFICTVATTPDVQQARDMICYAMNTTNTLQPKHLTSILTNCGSRGDWCRAMEVVAIAHDARGRTKVLEPNHFDKLCKICAAANRSQKCWGILCFMMLNSIDVPSDLNAKMRITPKGVRTADWLTADRQELLDALRDGRPPSITSHRVDLDAQLARRP